MPANLRETISSADGVTYWANHDKAARSWGSRPGPSSRASATRGAAPRPEPGRTLDPMARELPIFDPNPGHGHAPADPHAISIAMGGGGSFTPAADGTRPLRRHPDWIKSRLPSGENYHDLKGLLRGLNLNTVCEEAVCPNIGECWDQRTATVMILGDTCTRACGFCAIKTGKPTWFDDDEPRRVAEAVSQMRLDHVVVTSVARDDLPDGGASAFAATIRELRHRSPLMGVEVLIPDFNGAEAPLRAVMEAGPGHPQPQPRDRPPPPEAGPQARPLGPHAGRPRAGEGLRGASTATRPTPRAASWSAWARRARR